MSDGPFSTFSPSGTLFAYVPWLMIWKSNVFANAGIYAWLKLFSLVAFIVKYKKQSFYSNPNLNFFFCRFLLSTSQDFSADMFVLWDLFWDLFPHTNSTSVSKKILQSPVSIISILFSTTFAQWVLK